MSDRTDGLRAALTGPAESSVRRWFLLTGARVRVLVVSLLGVYVTFLAVATGNPFGAHDLLDETGAAEMLFSSLLSGAILLVSVVVSINSVVLSQEMTDLEDQQRRIDASVEYHRRIEEFIQADITPARPADFLSAVLYAISTQVTALVEATEGADEALEEDVTAYADHVAADIERARRTLSDTSLGSFGVLLVGLNYNYSGQLHATRGLKGKYEGDLTDAQRERIDRLVDTLKHVGVGREYFKSLYYKRELAKLSSQLLYVSLPVVLFTSYVILALDAGLVPRLPTFGFLSVSVFVLLAYTIALAPYVLLTVYVVRAATITLRTLSAGPFILQQGSDIDSLGWESPAESRDWELTERTDRPADD